MAPDQRPLVLDLFWDCLQASSTLHPELLAELRQSWTPESWRPLGEILVRSGALTLRQVAGLIGMQATEPYMRIGDLALREGLCTIEQVQTSLRKQRELCPGPIELLMHDERVDGEELLDALLKYARFLEGRLMRMKTEAHSRKAPSKSVV